MIRALGDLAADPDRRNVLHVGLDAADACEGATQLLNHDIGPRALVARLQRDKNPTYVERCAGAAGADGGHRAGHMGILLDDLSHLPLHVHHRRERHVLRSLGEHQDQSLIVGRQEPF